MDDDPFVAAPWFRKPKPSAEASYCFASSVREPAPPASLIQFQYDVLNRKAGFPVSMSNASMYTD
jgi:hypothetical protein